MTEHIPEGPSFETYGAEGQDPVLSSSVIDLTQPEVESHHQQDPQIQPSDLVKGPRLNETSPADIAKSQRAAHLALDAVEGMLTKGGKNNE